MIHAALLLGAFGLALAAAERMPVYDIEKTCRTMTEREAVSSRTLEACQRDEAAARDQLSSLWAGAKPATRAECGGKESVSAFGSYIDVLTCVQMAEGIVMRPSNPK